ncbi:hypothetical protein Clacol_007319 [Clathrus columnatus]|uniref:Uncharacterized protein n=1 Tax=Clathrus columnatus TaxID=1419009 RepID=A0AAV5AJM1_9AGAM|nr:hypothetical protein Clacol_007319 [Clathrus columnatus]
MTRHDEALLSDETSNANVITHRIVDDKHSGHRSSSSIDEKVLDKLEATLSPDVTLDAEDRLYDHNGKEKVLETPEDFATALVSLEDDPTLPVHTFRMWFSGLGLAVFGAVLGMLFQFRPQVISVSALFLQLLVYMFGKVLQFVIPGPGSKIHNGNRFWNFMNPGPFNKDNLITIPFKDIKEHAAAQIMANTAAGAATACFVFASDDLFYNITVNVPNAIFTLLASQLIGYGFAGLFRSFLVYPTVMLYPQNLITVNLFDVLHRSKGELLQGKRLRFFWIVVGAVFIYEWLPEYIAPLFGSINIVCLAARHSVWVSYIFGGAEANEGMGLLGFGLDWAIYLGWALNYLVLPLVFARNRVVIE